jgi:hypothetical protein
MCLLACPIFIGLAAPGRAEDPVASSAPDSGFPRELVDFQPYEGNPVFAGTGTETWDHSIRERGFILRDPAGYRLWYTGYFAYYHGTAEQPWKDWCTNVAMSNDLVHWKKYPLNPLVAGDRSSGVVVNDGKRYRLYTMHPDVRLYWGFCGNASGEAEENR